jgi:UV DNA damage endonuclease
MPIRIGYACINTQLPSSNKTCRVANATPERVVDLGRQNMAALAEILHWNREHKISLFRISSEIIPLGSHPANTLRWWETLWPELDRVGALIEGYGARVSMHPGQYTVLNSPRPEVVQAAIAELDYHARFLDALGTGASARIILHLGGVYGDKAAALARFAENFTRLPERVRQRLAIENDEKNYTIADALDLARLIGVPVVFDVFHHTWNPGLPGLCIREIIDQVAATWKPGDGPPKLHYSDQWPGKLNGAHSQSVDLNAFGRFLGQLSGLDADVMLEVKDKEQSVLAVYKHFGFLGDKSATKIGEPPPREVPGR